MFSCKILLCYFSKLSTCQLTNKSYFLFRGLSRTSFVNSVTEKILYYILKKNNGFYKQSVFTSCLTQLRIQRGNFSTYSDAQCWNCHRYLECEKFCCHLCGALQYPPKRINYFELFGISQMFDMDLEDLSLKFKNMQMTFHPDKYANKSKVPLKPEFHGSSLY